jgi:septal ring factor EnvC (AmiA/AmiB activator)
VIEEPEELQDEFPDDEQPRRPWLLIVLALILAALAGLASVQWKRAVDREEKLQTEMKVVYRDAESLRTKAAQAEQRMRVLEQQVAALTSERDSFTQRVKQLEEELNKLRRPKAAVKKPKAPLKR